MEISQLIQDGSILTLVTALNSVVGQYLPSKYLPLASIVLGLAFGFLLSGFSVSAGITGLVIGLSACGLYDQTKILKSEK